MKITFRAGRMDSRAFSFGPSIEEINGTFDLARKYWKASGREQDPRLLTSFWFALGRDARDNWIAISIAT